jgi:hypothetical protein
VICGYAGAAKQVTRPPASDATEGDFRLDPLDGRFRTFEVSLGGALFGDAFALTLVR